MNEFNAIHIYIIYFTLCFYYFMTYFHRLGLGQSYSTYTGLPIKGYNWTFWGPISTEGDKSPNNC